MKGSNSFVRTLVAFSLVITSGPAPVFAGPGVAPAPSAKPIETTNPETLLRILKVKDIAAPTCENEVGANEFSPLENALQRTGQALHSGIEQGKMDIGDGELGVEGAKHLQMAVQEVQKRLSQLDSAADDRAIKKEIGRLSLQDQLKQTLETGERAELFAQHFAAAEMLMIRRLIGGMAEVGEIATKALELNEEMAEMVNAAPKLGSEGTLNRLKDELVSLQGRRGEFLTARRKASELELEFVSAIGRLEQAAETGQRFITDLKQEQRQAPAIVMLIQSVTNLTQMASGALLFKQTVQTFDSNIENARISFDKNAGKTDLAIQSRIAELQLVTHDRSLNRAHKAEQNLPERAIPAGPSAAVFGVFGLLAAIGIIAGVMYLSGPEKDSIRSNYERLQSYQSAPPSSQYRGGAYESPRSGYSCFSAGTQVLTANGSVSIENLKRGSSVLSFNHQTGKTESARVVNVVKKENRLYGIASFSNGTTLEVTKMHEFYSLDRKAYVRISELNPGENVQLLQNEKLSSAQLKSYVPQSDYRDVYNFEVEGHHNYFVEGILVHNKLVVP